MSKPIVTINFDDLKYNLYEVLGLDNTASEIKIKKSFKKLIIELHPDKNPDSNEEIYNHVIMANQVLLNTQLRKDYDSFLNDKNKKDAFIELKQGFEEAIKDVGSFFPENKDEAKTDFKSRINDLNKKHGFNSDLDSINVMKQYEQIKKMRDTQISIPQEKIVDISDFNARFQTRVETGHFSDQIIASNYNSSLGVYQTNDHLVGIDNYSRLYAEDNISTGNFTSLDMAFKIQKINSDVPVKSLEERMKEYQNQSEMFKNRKTSDFSTKKFEDWKP